MDGMPRYGRVGLGLGRVTMFSVMVAFEILQEPDLTIADVVSEVLMTALLVGTTVTSALLLSRMRAQEERSADLRRGLDGVHALNMQWRTEMAEHVRELGSAIQRQFAAWGLTPLGTGGWPAPAQGLQPQGNRPLPPHLGSDDPPAGHMRLPEVRPCRPCRPVRVFPRGAPAARERAAAQRR